jgi:hypothetical protein
MDSTKEVSTYFKSKFIPSIIRWGRGLNLLGVVLCFTPCIGLALMGIFPPVEAFFTALAVQLPMVASAYVFEPVSYFAVLGIPGTYMSFLSGNISNLRLPVSSIAQGAAGYEEGSDEGTIIATIGIAISTFVNIAILTAAVFLGAYTLSKLPPQVTAVLNLLLPALFASMLTNYILQRPKLAIFGVPLAALMVVLQKTGLLSFLPSWLASSVPILVAVFGTMAIGISMAKRGKLE